MTGPIRVQLSRAKGWRMPEGTVRVARPGFWGNPFIVDPYAEPGSMRGHSVHAIFTVPTVEDAVACYREYALQSPPLLARLREIRGRNLACFCPLDRPCHADVLLDLANQDPAA